MCDFWSGTYQVCVFVASLVSVVSSITAVHANINRWTH